MNIRRLMQVMFFSVLVFSSCTFPQLPPPDPSATAVPELTFEEWRQIAQQPAYNDLLHSAAEHADAIVYYQGRVAEAMKVQEGYQLRVYISRVEEGVWEHDVLVRHSDASTEVSRGDSISFVGRVNGTVTYRSVDGRRITIPDISAYSLLSHSNES